MLISIFTLSLIFSVLLIATARYQNDLVYRKHTGPQQLHSGYVPRFGGIACFAGLLAGYMLSDSAIQTVIFGLLIAAMPVFLIGLTEDITARIPPRIRLAVALLTGVIFIFVTDTSITRVNIDQLDWLLQIGWISACVSILAIATLTNAVNIIDGLNGLSIGTCIIMAGAVGLIAADANDSQLFVIAMICVASMLGCFVINFPFGRIFAGDGGAYLMGAMVAMLTILLSERNAGISPFASLMIIFYPFYELVRSTVRRRLAGRNTMAPDKRHLHSLVFAYISRHSRLEHTGANSLSAAITWLLPCFCVAVAITFPSSSKTLFAGVLIFILLYEAANLWLKKQISRR